MIRKYAEIFCWKNVSSFCSAKATHIFSAKNIRILYIESTKTVNEMTLNELVKLTTLWTTGPSIILSSFSRVVVVILEDDIYGWMTCHLLLEPIPFRIHVDIWYQLVIKQGSSLSSYYSVRRQMLCVHVSYVTRISWNFRWIFQCSWWATESSFVCCSFICIFRLYFWTY